MTVEERRALTMGWGRNPADVRAAEEAQRAAIEQAMNRPMSPFERTLISVLEDIRDAVQTSPGPLDPLLDAPPSAFARAVTAGGTALAAAAQRRGQGASISFEDIAEVVIDAALREAARDPESTSPVEQQPVDGPGAGEAVPPAAPAPGAPPPNSQ